MEDKHFLLLYCLGLGINISLDYITIIIKIRLDRSWRRPHGIDCRVRRRYRGTQRCPKIGYGSNKKTKFLLPNYKLKFVVHNMKELECLMMNNEKYCAEIAATVGAVLRKDMLKRAKELSINITNQKSKKVEELEKKLKKDEKVE